MLRVITLNLNGVRSAYRKGLGEWLAAVRPDILCWQEVRAADADIAPEMRRPAGLRGEFSLPEKRGYSGVALFAKKKPLQICRSLAGKSGGVLRAEGRFLQMDFAQFSVISLYMPSGSGGETRQKIKERVMKELYPWLAARRKEADKTGRGFLLCGDINIAHTEKDIRNWRGNRNNSGFLPREREWLSRLFGEAGWVDVFRQINAEDGQYTWWSNRGRARENNVGWRIDYQIATPNFASRASAAEIYTREKFSDHAPLVIDYRGR
ncbi:MAG: exodeoxyribonuclease III [Gammaproteobacteria bacterium]